jgi:hypothetical protein
MSIFVSIISLKDPDLINTVRDLLTTAANPANITVGIVLQEDEENLPAYREIQKNKNVKLRIYPTSWARGCGLARAEVLKMYSGQDFFFQTDAHMRFDKGWDQLLVNEMKNCPPKSILTTLPPGFNPATGKREAPGYSEIVFSHFYRQLPITGGITYPLDNLPQTPTPTPFIAGGVLFGPGSICEIPQDPHFYFHGEEFTFNLRLWTHGYTNYSPRFNFCYHYYREHGTQHRGPTIAELNPSLDVALHEKSIARYHVLAGLRSQEDYPRDYLADLDRYGMGKERSISSWEDTYRIWLKSESIRADTPRSDKHKETVRIRS